MKASIARTASRCVDVAATPAENVVTIWIAGGSGPTHVDALEVHELGELLEPELDLPLGHQRADRHARRRLHDARFHGVGNAPALEQPARGARRSARSNS